MNDWERLHRQAEEYKESYPPGTRVMLLHMNDPYHPIDDGMRGTVDHVDDGANIHMRWDNGRTLALCPEDSFRRPLFCRWFSTVILADNAFDRKEVA